MHITADFWRRAKSGWWIWLIVLGLFLRILLASLLFHTDTKDIYRDASLISNGITQGYELGAKNGVPLPYPPVIYLIDNFYQQGFGWLFSSYYPKWMNDWSLAHVQNHPFIFQDLLVMKLPLLFFDFLVSVVLIFLAPVGKKRLIAALWLFNPFSLYAIYAFGNFDVMPTLFLLFSLYLFEKKKFSWSYLVLGIGAGFKLFPLLLLPFFLSRDLRPIKNRLVSVLLTFGVFAVSLAPIITSKVALKSVFLSNLTGGIYKATIDLGGGKLLPIYLTFYLFFVIAAFSRNLKNVPLLNLCFVALGALFGLSNFHPQWMVWIIPLSLVLVARGEIDFKKVVGFLLSYLGISLLIADKFVSFGLFKAINDAFDSLDSLRMYLDRLQFGSLLESVFVASFLAFFIWLGIEALGKVQVPTFFVKKINLVKIFSVWLMGICVIFFLVHLPLVYFGHYIDVINDQEQDTMVMDSGSVIKQQIRVKNDNFNGIALKMKNINLRYRSEIEFDIYDKNGTELRQIKTIGGLIGDENSFKLYFPNIKGSKDQVFTLSILPGNAAKGDELVLPYDGKSTAGGLSVSGKPVQGSLAFVTYYNPGGVIDNIKYSLANIVRKIF